MTLTIHKNMRGDGKGGVEYDKTWHITPVWPIVMDYILQGRDTPAKLFGSEGDAGLPNELQFRMAGQVLRDMWEAEVIEWEDKRTRLRLRVTDMGEAVRERRGMIAGGEKGELGD